MEPKQFKKLRHEVFTYMQKTKIESEGPHTFEVEADGDIVEITFDAAIDSYFSGDGISEERTGTDEVTITYVEVKSFGLLTTGQEMELENEVKLNV